MTGIPSIARKPGSASDTVVGSILHAQDVSNVSVFKRSDYFLSLSL